MMFLALKIPKAINIQFVFVTMGLGVGLATTEFLGFGLGLMGRLSYC